MNTPILKREACGVLGDRFGRNSEPGIVGHPDALVIFREDAIALIPVPEVSSTTAIEC